MESFHQRNHTKTSRSKIIRLNRIMNSITITASPNVKTKKLRHQRRQERVDGKTHTKKRETGKCIAREK
jgi:hypothetical protein